MTCLLEETPAKYIDPFDYSVGQAGALPAEQEAGHRRPPFAVDLHHPVIVIAGRDCP